MSLQSSLFTTALIGTLALLGGCSTFDSTWKSTKAFYGEYINPPAKIDYEDKGVLNDAETRLASRMVGIDIQLEQLERFLQNADRPPTGESVAILFHRFPWLSGLAAVDAEGTVLAQEPPAAMKELDFSRMLEQKPRGGELRGLRGLVEDTPLGPEVLTGIPVYSGSEMMGLLVAHFDMRSLLTYTSGAEDLVVLSPQGVLWPGRFVVDATPLTGQDWNEITRDSTHGTVSNKTGSVHRRPAAYFRDALGRAVPRRRRAVVRAFARLRVQFAGHDRSGYGIAGHGRRRGRQHPYGAAPARARAGHAGIEYRALIEERSRAAFGLRPEAIFLMHF